MGEWTDGRGSGVMEGSGPPALSLTERYITTEAVTSRLYSVIFCMGHLRLFYYIVIRPRGPTQAVLRACVLPITRAVRGASRRAHTGLLFCGSAPRPSGRPERTGTAVPGAYWTLKCPSRRAPTTLQTAGRLPGYQEEEDSCSLTRAASGAAAESPVRAASTWSAFIGFRRAAVVCVRRSSSAPPRPRQPPSQPVPPPDAERMRGNARARGWPGVGIGLTPKTGLNEEARPVRSTPTRVTNACRLDPIGVHQRPTTGGRLRVQLELRLPPTRRTPPFVGRLRMRDMRAPAGGATPGHEATISPPSRTCTLNEGVEEPRARDVAERKQLTPGSGPRRTPRRGAAGSDASSSGPSSLPRVRVRISSQTPPAQVVEVAPNTHGGERRPSSVRVCCRTRAPCAALRAAPRTGLLFCDYPQFIETPDLHHCTKAAPLHQSKKYIIASKPMSPHFNLLKCRWLGTAATSDVQNALTTLTRARRRRRGQRLADTCCFGCCCWIAGACCLDAVGVHRHPTGGGRLRAWIELSPAPSSTYASQSGAPAAAERMRDYARARGWPGVGTGLTS
ncbi:hypothetical protein EVAR_11896_1 [Eumeta japonica]|uniref:Uncharacterized protein n=1 Tax=Eumeta variegata TaxID=151549 RepID=A0A4C1U8E7_EUMVA|nr:hypothetical protein EVAR_11896_1 [Eumeta japonica]